jgi:hypothetical protein
MAYNTDQFSGGAGLTDGTLGNQMKNRVAHGYQEGTAITVTDASRIVAPKTGSAAAAVTLPAVADVPTGFSFILDDVDANANTNNITVTPDGSEQIDGGASLVISAASAGLIIYSDGSAWRSITVA